MQQVAFLPAVPPWLCFGGLPWNMRCRKRRFLVAKTLDDTLDDQTSEIFWDLLSFTSFPGSPPWVQLPPFDPQLNLFCTQNAQHFGRTWTRTHQTMEKCEQGVCSAPSTANFLLSFWLMSGSWHRLLRRSARRPCFRRITCPEWWRPQLP